MTVFEGACFGFLAGAVVTLMVFMIGSLIKEYIFRHAEVGEWIDYSDEGYVECPFCGHATNCEDNIDELHYCFYCGAKMIEPQERSDKE